MRRVADGHDAQPFYYESRTTYTVTRHLLWRALLECGHTATKDRRSDGNEYRPVRMRCRDCYLALIAAGPRCEGRHEEARCKLWVGHPGKCDYVIGGDDHV